MYLLVDLDKIDFDDDNILMTMILILLIISDYWLGVVNLKNAKHLKLLAWRPKRWWDWCMSEDEKILTEKSQKLLKRFYCVSLVYKWEHRGILVHEDLI